MDLRDLRGFLVIADELNITRAAGRLFLSQPAVSRLVRRLERDVGAAFFTRGAHAVSLTPAGEVLADRVGPLVADFDLAVATARATAGRAPDTMPFLLRLGVFYPAAAELTGPILTRFKAAHPNIRVRRGGGASLTREQSWIATSNLGVQCAQGHAV